MPIFKTRSAYRKVYRPHGSRYSDGRGATPFTAISMAWGNFFAEFGENPRQEETFIEVMGVTGDWVVTLFEIKEPRDNG